MGLSGDYNVADWTPNPAGYQAGVMVKYQNNIFKSAFWASEPGVGDPDDNGWRFYDELYDLTSNNPTQNANIIAYIPTWRKKEGFNYANPVMYESITHGIISFLMFEEDNSGDFTNTSLNEVNEILNDVVTIGHENNAQILIALGGATDYGFLFLMETTGNNSSDSLLQQTVDKVVRFVNDNNLDGVDLDLECWWGRENYPDQGGRPYGDPHPAGRGLTKFAEKLKQALPDKTVSAAVFATSWYGNCYDPGLAAHVDWIGVMSYDLTGSSNNSPVGPHTKLLTIRCQNAYIPEQQKQP